MSLAAQLKNLFSRKRAGAAAESSSDLSLDAPEADAFAAPLSADAANRTQIISAPDNLEAPDSVDGVEPVDEGELITLPFLGRRPARKHQVILSVALVFSLLVVATVAAVAVRQAGTSAQQVRHTGDALMQSQRLAKSVSQALVGSAQAFPEVRESASLLARSVRGLKSGDDDLRLRELSEQYQEDIDKIVPLMERTEKNASTVSGQQRILTQVGAALRSINRQSSDLLEIAESVSSLKLQQNASPAEISAAGQLVMLTQRIGKSANEFLTTEGVSPEAVFLLGKDLSSFREIAQGLRDGSQELRLPAARDGQVRERLDELLKVFDQTRTQATAILDNLRGLVSAREAQSAIIADSDALRRALEGLQSRLSTQAGVGVGEFFALLVFSLLAIACGFGLARVQLLDSRKRQEVAEQQRLQAERQEHEAKRVNDANQAAILRLMNELQTVAEGDLTQEATVTEDITGAIADSVNYTVEELRQLVGNVQNTATKVAQTTAQVESTSTELLAASTEQLREIRETGQSVLDMAARINQVSGQAQESAQVARQSLQAAESGLAAVQNAIGGMNAIRDQIQETSKRIKRLGESSQEIGEITELISDITEQTNVLAL
ncbi:MAG TPA: type IV pili methyl-accepting chemotaxis transducer N-terminal domain-containing protein, partial [Ramlibacter sp.]|nr:type IV pili methyl-accepting chemotaxis transducer N-terminal domain-containing protein [Ramlibacter sp.]